MKIKFLEKDKQLVVSQLQLRNYYELIDTQLMEIFLPYIKDYDIIENTNEKCICIIGVEHLQTIVN